MSPASEKSSFFRQSTWMILATSVSGAFMWLVHVLASRMDSKEWSVFVTLLRLFVLLGFPAAGLQIVFAQYAAAAVSDEGIKRLASATRGLLQGTFIVWLLMVALAFAFRGQILSLFEISNPAALWLTILLGLASLWSPILKGLLQGTQNFLGLGSVLLIDGIGRFTATAVILKLGGQAAGAMSGAFLGQLVSLSIALWLSKELWTHRGGDFLWRPWFREALPLSAAVGALLFMTSADVIYVQATFSKESTPYYMAGATVGYALIVFTTPLASVMFPKLVKSAALLQQSNAFCQTFLATAFLAGAAGVLFSLFPSLPLRVIYFAKPTFWEAAPLIPLFAWALFPLILANVLLGNLLARAAYAGVPWVACVALAYAVTLFLARPYLIPLDAFRAFKLVLVILGSYNLLLCAIVFFFWNRANRAEALKSDSRSSE